MPTFHTRQPSSIAGSVRKLVASSPNLTAADMLALDRLGAQGERTGALAEKARLEVEQARAADLERKNPARAAEYAGIVSGLPGGEPTRRMAGYVRGETIPPVFPMDDEGNQMPAAQYARPDVPAEQERVFRSALGALLANQLARGNTNADQLTEAQGNLLTQAVQGAMRREGATVPEANQLGASINMKTREPFSTVNPQGITVNQETGDIFTEPGIHGAAIKALEALGGQRKATGEAKKNPPPREGSETEAQRKNREALAKKTEEEARLKRLEADRQTQAEVRSRFGRDRKWSGKKLGGWTKYTTKSGEEKVGYEILDGDKVVGYYD